MALADAPHDSIVYTRNQILNLRLETRPPQGAEEEIPGLQGRREKTAKEDEISTLSPGTYGLGEQDM